MYTSYVMISPPSTVKYITYLFYLFVNILFYLNIIIFCLFLYLVAETNNELLCEDMYLFMNSDKRASLLCLMFFFLYLFIYMFLHFCNLSIHLSFYLFIDGDSWLCVWNCGKSDVICFCIINTEMFCLLCSVIVLKMTNIFMMDFHI